MRKMYLARSEPGSVDQPFSKASRADPTARSTSSSRACATSARCSSFAGSIVEYHSPESGSTCSPPTKSP